MELNINLSDKRSIEKAIAKLKSIKLGTDFDNKMVNNLVNICYDKCFENLESEKIYPNTQFREVKKTITKQDAIDGTGYVKIGYPAIMVEFGTGVIGKSTRNSDLQKLGFSDENDTSTWWIYQTDAGASNPYKWQEKDGTWRAWTHGVKSRPFAYNSALYVREIAKSEIRKALSEALK